MVAAFVAVRPFETTADVLYFGWIGGIVVFASGPSGLGGLQTLSQQQSAKIRL